MSEPRPPSDEGSTTDPAVETGAGGTSGETSAAGGQRKAVSLEASCAATSSCLDRGGAGRARGTAGGYLCWLNHQLGNIQRADIGVTDNPEKNHNEEGKPLNILLLGADNGDSGSVEEDLKDGKWTPFIHRSDTLMIAHIPADRKSRATGLDPP